jgi:hypothetical protein
MGVIIFLFVLFSAVIIYSLSKLLMIIKHNQFEQSIKYLDKFSMIVFVLLFLMQIVGVILYLIEIKQSEIIFVMLVKLFIQIGFFIYIFMDLRKLIQNLSSSKIFDRENIELTNHMGVSFIYLTFTEIFVAGLIALILFFQGFTFTISTNPTIILFVFIGLTLMIVSRLIEKANDIYEENQLTI